MSVRFAALLAALALLPLAPSAALAQGAAAAPPVADFFRKPQLDRPKLSPDGKYIAITVRDTEDVAKLATMELANPKNIRVVGGFADGDVGGYEWVDNEWLIYSSTGGQEGDVRDLAGRGLWSVARDGSDGRQLISPNFGSTQVSSAIVSRVLDPNWTFMSVVMNQSGEIIVGHLLGTSSNDLSSIRLGRLNVHSGVLKTIDTGAKAAAKQWYVDPKGRPWAYTAEKDDITRHYLRNADGEWQLWQEGKTSEFEVDSPVYADDTGTILIGRTGAGGVVELFKLDPKTLQRSAQPLVSTPGYDFEGDFVNDKDNGKLVGINFETDAPDTIWFVPAMKAAQAAVDKLLPGRINILQCALCTTNQPVIAVSSFSATQPGEFYQYDAATQQVQFIGASRPWIQPAQMGRRDYVRVKARDGLEFPMLVTQPRGKAGAPRPTIMLVHGGPHVRGTHWSWEGMAQFLASRGYVVLEPEFRGSTGYGWNLFHAGWKQWGLAMQDDVTDALHWAVDKGWVDASRVCIAGASYGGYAVLMGMIKDPDLYRCGIDWVGVTDLGYWTGLDWSDTGDEYRKYGSKVLVGDPAKDAEQFARTSPLKRAAEIKAPLLLAYGGKDQRVPMKHGLDFRDAVTAGGNKQVEWIFYGDEGHGWHRLSNNIDFWTRVEKFLARNIGDASPK